jgi:YjbE family integral membrane protein
VNEFVFSFENVISPENLVILGQVIMIDLVLAGDNAIVIGLAAAGLPKSQRAKAILIGILAATILRTIFAIFTTQLLQILGLLLVGGILLLWVCWKMWRELKDTSHKEEDIAIEAVYEEDINSDGVIAKSPDGKTFAQAAWQIIIADVSMSLDTVLAVAGAADGHLEILAIGLILSIALMGLAASFIARLLNKHRWIAFVGLAIILYVAIKMIYDGILEILPHIF